MVARIKQPAMTDAHVCAAERPMTMLLRRVTTTSGSMPRVSGMRNRMPTKTTYPRSTHRARDAERTALTATKKKKTLLPSAVFIGKNVTVARKLRTQFRPIKTGIPSSLALLGRSSAQIYDDMSLVQVDQHAPARRWGRH